MSAPFTLKLFLSSFYAFSLGRARIDNSERCRQYRQRKKNEAKNAVSELEVQKVRNIELKSKVASMEEQHKKMKKMILHFFSLKGKTNPNLENKIKLEFSFLNI